MTATGMSDRPRWVSVRAALLPALLLCAGCALPGGTALPSGAPDGSDTSAASASTAAIARDVIAEVNRTRRSNHLNPLIEDAALNRAAREHSKELAARRTLDHNSTNPARRTMTMRIEAAGGTWSRAAENLLNMSGQAAGVPSQTVRMWLSSEAHRRNMLSPDYTHTGVGVAIDQRGIWYVTQLYVFPRPVR